MTGAVLAEGNWDFTLDVHESESFYYKLQKEYEIGGYPVQVEAVEFSPISLTIFFDVDSIRAMENGEKVNLDQLDCLPALYPTGVRYKDETEITEIGSPIEEGYTNEEKTVYQVTLGLTKAVDAEKVSELLMGEDGITF